MSACEKSGQWPFTLEIFKGCSQSRVQVDVCTYGATISACEKGERWERAIQCLLNSLNESLESSLIGYNAAISACGNKRQWVQCLSLFLSLKSLVLDPSQITLSAMISAFDVEHIPNLWELCLYVLHVSRQKVLANLITFNAALSACANASRWREAFLLVGEMAELGLQFDQAAKP